MSRLETTILGTQKKRKRARKQYTRSESKAEGTHKTWGTTPGVIPTIPMMFGGGPVSHDPSYFAEPDTEASVGFSYVVGDSQISDLRRMVMITLEQVSLLRDEVANLAKIVDRLDDEIEPETRTLTSAQAEKEILAFFEDEGELSYSDISEALNLDIETIVSACESLVKKGKIEPQDK